jgi:hypothetical protein
MSWLSRSLRVEEINRSSTECPNTPRLLRFADSPLQVRSKERRKTAKNNGELQGMYTLRPKNCLTSWQIPSPQFSRGLTLLVVSLSKRPLVLCQLRVIWKYGSPPNIVHLLDPLVVNSTATPGRVPYNGSRSSCANDRPGRVL